MYVVRVNDLDLCHPYIWTGIIQTFLNLELDCLAHKSCIVEQTSDLKKALKVVYSDLFHSSKYKLL